MNIYKYQLNKLLIWFLIVIIAFGYNFAIRLPKDEKSQTIKITPKQESFKVSENPKFTLEIEHSKTLRRFFRLAFLPWPIARAEEESVIASLEQSFGFYGVSDPPAGGDEVMPTADLPQVDNLTEESNEISAPLDDLGACNDSEAQVASTTDFVIETPNPQVLGEIIVSEATVTETTTPPITPITPIFPITLITTTSSTTDTSLIGQALEKVGDLIEQVGEIAQETLSAEPQIEVEVIDPQGKINDEVKVEIEKTENDQFEITLDDQGQKLPRGDYELEVQVQQSILTSTQHQTFNWGGREIPELRNYTSKTFDNLDGTYEIEAHLGQIHYQDEATNSLEDVDTTLIDQGDKWVMDKASYHAQIPKYADQEMVFQDVFENKDQTIIMIPQAQYTLGEIENTDGWENKRVRYKDAYGPNIDLRVTVGNVGLFKEVIVNQKPENLNQDLVFDFQMIIPEGKSLYLLDSETQELTKVIDVNNLELTGDKQLLIGDENSFSYIQKIRLWDSAGNETNGKLRFYQKDNKIYFQKIIPQEFLKIATFPIYTDDTATYYSGAGDGYVYKADSTVWATVHDAAAGQAVDYTNTGATNLGGVGYFGSNLSIARGFFPITTSALPDNAAISAATFSVYVTSTNDTDNDGNDFMTVVQTSQASSASLVVADYNECGATTTPTEGIDVSGRQDITNISSNAYLTFTLNSTGIGWISLTGTTLLGLREGHDTTNHAYAGTANTYDRILGYYSEYTGTGSDPYLSVTYTYNITLSGTIYSDDGSTVYNCSTNNLTVAAKVNGAGSYSTTCTASGGTYSLTVAVTAASNVITVFIDGEDSPSVKATTVTKNANTSSAISGLDLYQNRLIVRHEDAGPITNANLDQCDTVCDGDIAFQVIPLTNSNFLWIKLDTELHVWTGKSFSPGGVINTNTLSGTTSGNIHLDDNSTLTAGGTIALSGSWIADSGTTFTPNSKHLEFTATSTGKTITPGSSSFYDLEFASLAFDQSYDATELYIKSLTFDSTNGVIYAGSGDNYGIIYRCATSTGCDAAADWTSYSPMSGCDPVSEVYCTTRSLTIDSTNGVVYAGAYYSYAGTPDAIIYRCATSTGCDATADWTTSYDTTESYIRSLGFDSTNGVIYAGSGTGGIIYRCATSTLCDASTDWTTSYDTTPDAYILSLTFDSTNGVLYAGTGTIAASAHIYRCATSTLCDAAGDWTTSFTPTEWSIHSLTFDSTNGVLYAGTDNGGIIYRCATSTGCDAESEWTTSVDTPYTDIYSLTFDSANKIVYAGASGTGNILRCHTSTGCDADSEWSLYDTAEIDILSFTFDSTNRVVYAGTGNNDIIYRTSPNNGGWTFQANATTTDNFTIAKGTVIGPSSGHIAVAGSWANNGGTFTPNSSEVKFNASATGKTLASSGTGNLIFYDTDFNSSTGGWTVQNNATSTRNWKLTSGAFTASSGVHAEVDGQFTNITSGTTTWTGSYLYLNSGSAYTINTKTAGSDTYATLEIGANTDIRMWDSSASSYNVSSSGSLYSMDHAGTSGDLAIYGDYHVPSASTDYWSYATDFDGTASANRQVDVLLANSATVNVDSGTTLQIIGTNTATTTATSTSVTGSYGFTLTNGTLNAQYYKFGRLNASGLNLTGASATITNLANGEFDNSGGSGASDTFITVAGDVITNNAASTFSMCNFNDTNSNAEYNVTATGSTASYWTFSSSYGAFDGEAYDLDPGGDPGYIRWDDSTSGTLSETASSSATFASVTYSFSSQNDTGNKMGAVFISDSRGAAPGWDLNVTSADWSRTGGGSMDYDGDGSSTGQLCLVLSGAAIYAISGSMTGVTKGSDDCFDSVTTQIQIADATVGNGVGTYWLVDVTMSQFIPAMQQAGAYTTTLSIVAS